jgi:hypothetical protein
MTYNDTCISELVDAAHALVLAVLAAGWTEDVPALGRAQRALLAILPAPEPAPEPEPEPEPARVLIRSRYRDLNSKGRGTECYRMYLDPTTDRGGWLDKHPDAIVTERGWCARGIRASERKCHDRVEIPVGTLILDIDKSVGSGGTTYQVGYVKAESEGSQQGTIEWEGGNGFPPVRHCGTKGIGVHIVEIDGVRHTFHTTS